MAGFGVFKSLAAEARRTQPLPVEQAGLHRGLLIPDGFYVRGGAGFADANPHWAYLSHGLFVSMTATTQGEYGEIMGRPVSRKDRSLPARGVSWNDADTYNRAHNSAYGTAIGLLTEAWHQRAQRGPVVSLRQVMEVEGVTANDVADVFGDRFENAVVAGDGPENLRIFTDLADKHLLTALNSAAEVYCWRKHGTASGELNPKEAWFNQPGPTGAAWGPPNGWGLSENEGLLGMCGGIWEWVRDWYSEDAYPQSLAVLFDPTGPAEGKFRELLGGSWCFSGQFLRAAYRSVHPDNLEDDIGFRVGWRPGIQTV